MKALGPLFKAVYLDCLLGAVFTPDAGRPCSQIAPIPSDMGRTACCVFRTVAHSHEA